MGFYSKYIFPHIMEWGLSGQPVMDLRIKALRPAKGKVLEIGFGTGLNISCYPPTINELIAVDTDVMMAGRARNRVSQSPFQVRREVLDASKMLPFPDGSFDTVVTTFTVCSIRNIRTALAEMRRVLKPEGVYLFLEHGRSGDARVARLQDWLNPMQNLIGAGCNLNRRIDQLIVEAGFGMRQIDRFTMANTPRVIGEVYTGVAELKG